MMVKLTRDNGVLKVNIDGKLYNPLSFKSFRPNPQNVSEFYAAGVRLFSVLTSGITSALGVPYSLYGESWVGDGKYDFSAIDRQMDMFIENAPDAYFAPMIQLDTRDWYLKEHPEVPNSFTHLSQIACDGAWKKAAAEYLKAAITHIEEKYGDRVYGYFMLCGTTTEWFSDHDYEAPHPIKNAGYKRWRNDLNVNLPSTELLNKTGDVFLEKDEDEVYLARKFHNELISELILYFAEEAQSVIKKNKLLGVYYGYLFELGIKRLYNAGSLGYEKVFFSPLIDMISSPSSYGYRGINDPSAFMVTQKTLDAHNKLYFLEFDHITHVAPERITEGLDENSANCKIVNIPGAANKCKNETESLNLMYRDFALCMSKGAALWWFDMFDGWFRSQGMMNAVSKMLGIAEKLSSKPSKSIAQIAVFAEGESMYRARKSCGIPTVCLDKIRRTLAECGAPYDLYSISDLALAEADGYQMYIFVNQYDIKQETKALIEEKCKAEGKTVLWLYAPGFATDGDLRVENIADVTGITVEAGKISHGKMVYNGSQYDYPLTAPYFSVCDKDADVLALFEDGSAAVAKKEIDGFKSVYCAACNLPSELLRDILIDSGIFVYSKNSLLYTYVNSESIGVYNATGNDAEIYLKEDGVYHDLICDEDFKCENGILKLKNRDINAFILIKKQETYDL